MMDMEYEGHVSCKSDNSGGDEDGLYEMLCEREPTVSIPMATSRVQIVNCKYEKPIVGSPEELVEAESYTEPDKWEEPFDQDTVVVEAYPTVEFHHGKDTSGSSRLVTGEYLQRNKNTSQVTVEAIGKKDKPTSSGVTCCLRTCSPLRCVVENEPSRDNLLLLYEVFKDESVEITDCDRLKEMLLNCSIRQPLDAFNLQRIENKLKQWDSEKIRKLANLLQIREEDDKLVEKIVQRLDNLKSWTSPLEESEEECPKRKKKRTDITTSPSSEGCLLRKN